MSKVLCNAPEMELAPDKRRKLPDGVVVSGNRAEISDKRVALELHDLGCPVFSLGEDGKVHLFTKREDIEAHTSMYCTPAVSLDKFLEITDREPPAPDKTEEQKIAEQRDMALSEISAFTGISRTQLQGLPLDIQEELIATYMFNVNIAANPQMTELLNSVIEGKPIASVEQQENKLPENYMKTTEELIEGNYNSIDGVINNLPKDDEGRTSVIASINAIKAVRNDQPEAIDVPESERNR